MSTAGLEALKAHSKHDRVRVSSPQEQRLSYAMTNSLFTIMRRPLLGTDIQHGCLFVFFFYGGMFMCIHPGE